MLKPLLTTSALALALAAPAHADGHLAQFSENSQATPWNLGFEVPARFNATVVDLLCEVAGDCDNECAPGRQMALLRHADGVLTYPNKNGQPLFTGAAVELEPYCGLEVEVDGLLIDDPEIGATNVYLMQCIREIGTENWEFSRSWTVRWAEENPDVAGSGPWFRRDPRVLARIEALGYLGNGLGHQEAWEITR